MSTLTTTHHSLVAQGYEPLTNEWWVGMHAQITSVVVRRCRAIGVPRSSWDEIISTTLTRMSYVNWAESDANIMLTIRNQIHAAIAREFASVKRNVAGAATDERDLPFLDPTDQWIAHIDFAALLARTPLPEQRWLQSRMDGHTWTTIALGANLDHSTVYRRVRQAVLVAQEDLENASSINQ